MARIASAGQLLALALCLACTQGDGAGAPPATTPTQEATPTAAAAWPATATATATATAPIAPAPADPPDAASSSAAVVVDDGVEVPLVAVTNQRGDVFSLSVADVRRILMGEIRDWSELGGSELPIRVYLDPVDAAGVAAALDIPPRGLRVSFWHGAALANRVAAESGSFALVHPQALQPGLLALVVDGHDPYLDPASESPLRARVAVPDAGSDLDGTDTPFDPVLLVATGELIPARCTNYALETLEDDDAMFDGVRDLLARADLAAVQLEAPLTSLSEPTPCERTFVLQGRAEVIGAVARAGVDVIFPIGNHITDCWEGCARADVLTDTLTGLHEAGLLTAGAGEDLEESRTPAVVEVETEAGPVSFAFLGYDTFAPWQAATEETPGVAPYDPETLAGEVRRARRLSDHVVVAVNWGVEYTADPTTLQREIAHAAIEAGASLVVGNHPHWVQATEHIEDGLAVYALGNFVFDQSWSDETTQSAILEASFLGDRLIGYRLRPLVLRGLPEGYRALYQPQPVDPAGEEGAAILERIWEAGDRLPPWEEDE